MKLTHGHSVYLSQSDGGLMWTPKLLSPDDAHGVREMSRRLLAAFRIAVTYYPRFHGPY